MKSENTTYHFEMITDKSSIQIKVELFYNYEDLLQLHKIACSYQVHGLIEKIKLSVKIPLAVFLVVVPVYVIILESLQENDTLFIKIFEQKVTKFNNVFEKRLMIICLGNLFNSNPLLK